jgi:CPA1 family monovalent cation:H+ antiporter
MGELEQLLIDAVRHELRVHVASETTSAAGHERRADHNDFHRAALDAARHAVLAMRASNEIGDDAFHQLEEQLDWLEMIGDRKTE